MPGVIRSTSGNLHNILNRIQNQKKALGAILPAGMAKGHRGNPIASIRAYNVHVLPVLISCLSSLVLKESDIYLISQQHKKTIKNLQKLYDKTPDPIIFFLSGTLPGKAVLHLRQFSLLSMISHLQDNPLHQHLVRVLATAKQGASSWVLNLRDTSLVYGLSHPLQILQNPMPKSKFKAMIKRAV